MSFKNLLDAHTDDEILHRIIELYPDSSYEGYAEVLKQLRELTPTHSDVAIYITRVEDEEYGAYYDVSGLSGESEYFGIEFRPWQEWLAMPISDETEESLDDLDILAHSLWEMTFVGYSNEEIQEQWDELARLANAVQAGDIEYESVDGLLEEFGVDVE